MMLEKDIPKVAVVILNWNGQLFLEKFLPSVFNSTYPNVEFVVGDNASTDNSVSFVRKNYPAIRIVENAKNLGFAGGYNEILRHVTADYYVLLNSDVEVTPNWIEPVIQYLESDPTVVVAQPKILAYHNKTFFEHAGASGGFIDFLGYPFCRGRILHCVEEDLLQYENCEEIFWASGAAFFIKSSIWQEVGGFDEDFFAHMEEIDLCWRLKQSGYRIGICPQSVVYHVGGGTLNTSNPNKTYLNFRNNLVMLQKNLPFWTAVLTIFARLWLDFLALLKFLLEQKPKDAWAISRAHQYFFRHLLKNAKKRNVQKSLFNKAGWYRNTIIWDFYIRKKNRFSDLNPNKFL